MPPGRWIDGDDAVHLRRHDDDGTAERDGAARETGARAAGSEWTAVPPRQLHARLHFGGRQRKAHDGGVAAPDDRCVVPIQLELVRLRAHSLVGECSAKIGDECVAHIVGVDAAGSHESILPPTNVHSVKLRPPEDLHEWISFEDPDEERTWVFDLTFLTSPWTCIFGRGCPGVLTGPAPELVQGCCSYGAHFTGNADRKRVE